MTTQVPQPPSLPFLGNALYLDADFIPGSLAHLADIYGDFRNPQHHCLNLSADERVGPIYKLSLGGSERNYISTGELFEEVCDEKRFHKVISGALYELRNGVHDGLDQI